jgi:nicotinate-nucleotide adenylyltransferase
MSKKIGIYAGTFDPVHVGHLAFAREALEHCGLDKVYFMVEPRPRRKQAVKALEHRAEMVRLSIADEPKFSSIVLNQQRFTADKTLPVLMELFKGAQIHMLMGDDVLAHLAGWPHVEDLIKNVRFVVGLRKFDKKEIERRLKILQRTRGFAVNYELFEASKPEYSSSAIRLAIKKSRQPEGLLPQVTNYIQSNNLYADSSGSGSDVTSS